MAARWTKYALLTMVAAVGTARSVVALDTTPKALCFDVATPDPMALACGAVDRPIVAGTTRRLQLTITNNDGATANLLEPAPAPPFFACTEATGPCNNPFPINNVPNGGSATVFIEYRPTTGGASSTTLNLNASGGGFASVSMRGKAHLLDIVLLFDNSGSMSWRPNGEETADPFQSRLRFARDAAKEFVALLDGTGRGSQTRVAVCVFNYGGAPNSTAPCTRDLLVFSKVDLDTSIDAVPVLWAGTQMGRGLEAARDRPQFLAANHKPVIVMLSNGAHNAGIAPEGIFTAMENRPLLFAVAYGSMRDVDPGRLSALVVESGNTVGDGFRHYDPLAPAGATQLDKFFLTALYNLGLRQAAADPTSTVAPGQTQTHDIDVTDLDRLAQFMVSWETPPRGQLSFDLLAPDGTVVNPAVARTEEADVDFTVGSSYMLYDVHEGYLRRPGKVGRWKMRVRLDSFPEINRAVAPGTFTYNYSAYMDSGLEMTVRSDRVTYNTGDPITFTAAITANGMILKGAAVDGVQGRLHRPDQGIGTWHAEHGADPQWIAAIPALRTGEPLSGAQRKGLALTLVGGIAPPGVSAAPDLTFTDDGQNGDVQAGDGIYTARFTDTSKPDTYTFHITAKGRTPGGKAFTREALVQQFVPVNVVPDLTLSPLTFQVIQVSGPKTQVLVTVVPKDRFGNFLGPGHADMIVFQATQGVFVGPVQDDLRGGYSRVLEYTTATENPDVTVVVDGKPFPTQDVQQASGPRYEIGVFVGRFWFDKHIPVDDGTVFGVRIGRPLSSTLTVEGELGLTPTDDAFGQGGTVYQASVNLRWSLGALTFHNLTPFVTGGLGVLGFSGFTVTDTSAAANFGVGLSARVTPRASFRIDARDFVGFSTFGRKTDNFQVTLGFTIGF